ncbi:MAG: hypothetical protein ABI378_05740 [Chitinophagaceae bacterium]
MNKNFTSLPPKGEIYFLSATVVRQIPVFNKDEYRQIIIDSLQFCQEKKGLNVHAWVIMPEEVSLIVSGHGDKPLGYVMRDFKSFTSKTVKELLYKNVDRTKADWLPFLLEREGKYNSRNNEFQLWRQDGSNPVLLNTDSLFERALTFLHLKPVVAGFVIQPEYWKWSSAADYLGDTGLLRNLILK